MCPTLLYSLDWKVDTLSRTNKPQEVAALSILNSSMDYECQYERWSLSNPYSKNNINYVQFSKPSASLRELNLRMQLFDQEYVTLT